MFKCPICLDGSSDEEVKTPIKTRKRVKFNDSVQIVYIECQVILPEVSWMMMARDRRRFEKLRGRKCKVCDTSSSLQELHHCRGGQRQYARKSVYGSAAESFGVRHGS